MIYLYAFTDLPHTDLPAVAGLDDGAGNLLPISAIIYQDIAAVVSRLESPRLPAPETNVWRHEAVIEALMTIRTVLPARFGSLVKDEDVLQAALAKHYASLAADLQHLQGRVEVGVRVMWTAEPPSGAAQTEPPAAPQDGRAYMLARLKIEQQEQKRRQEANWLAAEIHGALNSLAVASQQQVLATPRLLLKASYLVPRTQVEAFRSQFASLNQAYPELHFLCVGPWPPYSFVSALNAEPAAALQLPGARDA